MRVMVAILSTVLSLLLWWNQSGETDLFQINEQVGQISTVLNEHARQIEGLNEKTLSFDKGEELKRFVKPQGGIFEGVGKFFESFGSQPTGQAELQVKQQQLDQKIAELQQKINSWQTEVDEQAKGTRVKLDEMARQTTELSQKISSFQIKEGFLSGPRIRWWAFILSLVMTAMAWIAAFWEESPEEQRPDNSNGGIQPAPLTSTAEDEIENPATYRAIKQTTVYGHSPDTSQILWEGSEIDKLDQLYPRTGDRRTDKLADFSCGDFEETKWFEVKTKRGWRICEDPRSRR